MTAHALPERTVIRATWLVVLLGLFAAGNAVVWIGIALVEPALNGLVARVGAAAFGLAVAAPFAWSIRMRAELDHFGIAIVTPMHTVRIPWRDVRDVTVDELGLRVWRYDGSVVRAGALGKSRISILLRRLSAADDRLETVRSYLAAYRSRHAPAAPTAPGAA